MREHYPRQFPLSSRRPLWFKLFPFELIGFLTKGSLHPGVGFALRILSPKSSTAAQEISLQWGRALYHIWDYHFFFKIPNSLDTEFELHQSSMLFVQTMETQGQASFYVEQPVAWLTREVKLNAVVTFYFAGPRAARYSEHPFPSLLLSWFRAPSRWEHWSLQLGDCAAGSGTLISESVTAPPPFFANSIYSPGVSDLTLERQLLSPQCV